MTNANSDPRRRSIFVVLLLWGVALSYGFADWGIYRAGILLHGDQWRMYLHGGIQAPFQYRIGSWVIVDGLQRAFHMRPYDTLTLIDVVCLVVALWLLLRLPANGNGLEERLPPRKFLLALAVLFFAEYYLTWGHWFQSPETLPSILFVTVSMVLVYGDIVSNRTLACILLIAFSGLQGFFRADVAVVLHGGFFLTIVLNRKISAPLGRARQAIVSLVAAVAAGCVQLYLMFVRFPHARYGPEGAIQIVANFRPGMWLTMLLTFFPYFVFLGLLIGKRIRLDGPQTMLLVASVLYLALWAIAGQLDETRIFLPFAFALIPATAAAWAGFLSEKDFDPGASAT